jgi:ubiquinone/menaquinone biosynthesis C-methylase UbiE
MNKEQLTKTCKVYESAAWRQAAGGIMRPGGLELTQKIVDLCGLTAGDRVVDVGCGAGFTVEYLLDRGIAAVGIEPSAVQISYGRQRSSDLPLIQGAGDDLPLNSGEFHGILAECSLSVMPDIDLVLTEFYRILRPAGKLVISDVYVRNADGAAALCSLPPACCLSGALLREAWVDKIVSHGFSVFIWEDCSYIWKDFLGNIILEYGSLEKFWNCTTEEKMDGQAVAQAVSNAKPGYFIMGAVKV